MSFGLAGGLLSAALLSIAAPVSARTAHTTTASKPEAAGKPAHKRHTVAREATHAKRARHAKAEAEAEPARREAGHRRVSVRMSPRSRHAEVRHVTYSPAQPSLGRAFGLHDAPDSLALRSSVAYMVDQDTSEALFDKNSHAVLPIASITKLMTAMVTLDAKLPLTETLTVTDEDRDMEKGTGSRLSVGSRLSREDMLHIALMASENRAAAALSRYYPGGRPAFVVAMNLKAKTLGMNDTHFIDPTGLTSQNVSSARDLAKMVNAAYQYPLIRKFSTDVSYEVNTGRKTIHYNSTNALVRNASWDIGLQKTGFINEAGECLVMQATIHDRHVIMVLLDSFGKYSRFGDAQRLRAWMGTGGVQRVTSADTGHAGT